MISSMTAFAREEYRGELGVMSWEIRSVNHRYLEAFLRLPEELRVLESSVRERLSARLNRGKLDVSLKFKPGGAAEAGLRLNRRMVDQLLSVEQEMAGMLNSQNSLRPLDLLRWPGVLEEEEQDFTPVKQQAMALLETALAAQQLGLNDALNLDGGSSTTVVVAGQTVMNGRGSAPRIHNGLGFVPL